MILYVISKKANSPGWKNWFVTHGSTTHIHKVYLCMRACNVTYILSRKDRVGIQLQPQNKKYQNVKVQKVIYNVMKSIMHHHRGNKKCLLQIVLVNQ